MTTNDADSAVAESDRAPGEAIGLTTRIAELARQRDARRQAAEDAARAAEEAEQVAEQERLQAYRASFDPVTLEAADEIGVDPREVLGVEILDRKVRVTTEGGLYENDGTGWTCDDVPRVEHGPFGLRLTRVLSPADLTAAERAELDRWLPPHRPDERATLWRSEEGLVAGCRDPQTKMRTLLPGSSGRACPVGLLHPDDWPASAYRGELLVWTGPRSCLPAGPYGDPAMPKAQPHRLFSFATEIPGQLWGLRCSCHWSACFATSEERDAAAVEHVPAAAIEDDDDAATLPEPESAALDLAADDATAEQAVPRRRRRPMPWHR
jgi:hypothetical protein